MVARTGDILRKIVQESPDWKALTDQELKTLKDVLLEIADNFVALCEKHNLKYCMAYGTALGAVRHKGYIPWDDDIDFFMPRKDYEKFLRIAEIELKDKYYIRSVAKGDKVGFPTLHMRLKNTLYVNYGDLVITANEPENTRGIYIDIAPLDNSSDNKLVRNINAYICLAILFISSCIVVRDTVDYVKKNNFKVDSSDLKLLRTKVLLGKIFSIIPMHKWMLLYDNLCARNRNEKSKYVISYCGMKNIKKGTYKRTDMYPFKEGIFEKRKWMLPHNADAFLTTVYNDYMVIPKEENQKIHPVFFINFDISKNK